MPGYAGNNNHNYKKGVGRVRTFKKFSSLLKKSAKKSKRVEPNVQVVILKI